MSYVNKYGLLNARVNEELSENTFLFTLQNYLLRKKSGMSCDDIREKLMRYIEDARQDNGMYSNVIGQTSGKEAYLSHDQMSAYCVFSVMEGLEVHRHIFSSLMSNFGTYDNISGKFNIKRIMHPRDIIWLGMINNSIFWKFISPIYWFIGSYTFITKWKVRPTITSRIAHLFKTGEWQDKRKILKTDSELIFWCKRNVHNGYLSDFFYKFFDYMIIKRFNGWRNVFSTYYEAEHPNNKFLKY